MSRFSEEHAEHAIRFIENLEHWEAPFDGEPLILLPWQEKIIRDLFGTLNEDGLRKYRTAYVEIPRKNGKTKLAAAIALYLLFADGKAGAQVYCAAYDRDQAKEVWNDAKQMYLRCDELQVQGNLVEYKNKIECETDGGILKPLSREVKKQHGKNITGLIFDEIHTQKSDDMWTTLTTAQGTREEPLTFGITTAGADRESLCRSLHDMTIDTNNGTLEKEDHYGVIFSADPDEQSFPESWYDGPEASFPDDWPGVDTWELEGDCEWQDEESWKAANPSMETEDGKGFRKFDEFKSKAKQAKSQLRFRNRFKRLYLNIWTESTDQDIDIDSWNDCVVDYDTSPDILPKKLGDRTVNEMLPSLKAYGGLDLANKHDIAAFVLTFAAGKHYFYKGWYFVPEETVQERTIDGHVPYRQWVDEGYLIETPGAVIDYSFIFEAIKQAAQTYNIQDVAFDRWGAEQIRQELTNIGIDMVEFGQGYKSMSPPTKELDKIIRSNRLVADDDPVMRWAMGNVKLQENPAGALKPHKKKSSDKIDPVVAFIMSLDRAVRHTWGDASKESVYEERGLTVI